MNLKNNLVNKNVILLILKEKLKWNWEIGEKIEDSLYSNEMRTNH